MRIGFAVVALTLLAACASERPGERGLEVRVSPLSLPGIGDACFDLRVTNGAAGAGDVVWTRGTPGLNGGVPDPGAICSDRYGDGRGDITWVGPCDASGQLDLDPQGERINSVTLWFDGLYDAGGAYLAPAGPGGWQDPCPSGCTLDVLCEENADARASFDLTVLRDARQGFFDVAVAFDDIFCSAKLDTCQADGTPNRLLFGAAGTRDWTAVFGFACSGGVGSQTRLHYGDLAVVCTSGPTTTVFPLNPVGEVGNSEVVVGDRTLHYGVYRGAESLGCEGPGTGEVESCAKVYWNLAVSLDDLSGLGTCTLAFAATATSGDGPLVAGRPDGDGVAYPFVEVAATLSPPSCQRHALNDGGAVRTVYRGSLVGSTAVMCSRFDGLEVGPVPGADCSDSCPNDPDKTLPGLCGCGVADLDGDGDLVVDCLDGCPGDTSKTAAGVCGCGVSDADGDGDTFADCIDLCASDASKSEPGECGCGVPDDDGDLDLTPDCFDDCPEDAGKVEAGGCGCGVADTDTDGDGVADCEDLCSEDELKTAPGVCGCGVADMDSDGDGAADCEDLCPEDEQKIAPGLCGCGVADTNTDGDALADCQDACPADANKIAPGVCGCGMVDTDSDGDGVLDCQDLCPADGTKVAPGVCGCGTAETNGDGDALLDCQDPCPTDPNKVALGICGCGVADTDSDGDLTADCVDGCPADPGKTSAGTCGCGVPEAAADRLGGTQANAASSCVEVLEAGEHCGNGTYWIDPSGGSTSDAYAVYCDMAGGGWMKVESATWPFWFGDATWQSHNATAPTSDNYSIVGRRSSFVGADGCTDWRVRVGGGANWLGPIDHENAWRQCHDPFTESTNGSDYTFISGVPPTTCGGFNGLHHKYQTHSYTSDPDAGDSVNCWWMQIVPKQQYDSAASYPGYLDGYGGSGNSHKWQSLWIKARGLGYGREAPATSCAQLGTLGRPNGTYWLDPDGGEHGDAFKAYCDITGGGWARLIGPTTTAAELAALPVTSNTVTDFINDATYGVSWGTFTSVSTWGSMPYQLTLDLPYGELKVTHSGSYNSPAGGLGVLYLNNQSMSLLVSSDGHTDGGSGQTLTIKGVNVFALAAIDLVNRTDVIAAAGSTTLQIAMNAYTSGYAYTRRYIRELWFR
jgi:hypothetical protein